VSPTPPHPNPWCGVLLSGVPRFLLSLFHPFLLCRRVPNPPLFLLFFTGVFPRAFSLGPFLVLARFRSPCQPLGGTAYGRAPTAHLCPGILWCAPLRGLHLIGAGGLGVGCCAPRLSVPVGSPALFSPARQPVFSPILWSVRADPPAATTICCGRGLDGTFVLIYH